MSAKAPFVAIRTDIRKEERVGVIADVAGYNRHEALGRLVELWAWCTDRVLDDAPDDCEGYAVSDAVVRRFLGPLGVEAILGGGCDELALGERRPDGLVYLRGTSETVSRLRDRSRTAGAGGVARAAIGRRESGRFVGAPTFDQRPAGGRLVDGWCADQPESSREPAVTSEQPQATEKRERGTASPLSLVAASPKEPRSSPRRPLDPAWSPPRTETVLEAERHAASRGVDVATELAQMRDWAVANAAKKASWSATWTGWLRRARATSAVHGRGHERPQRTNIL